MLVELVLQIVGVGRGRLNDDRRAGCACRIGSQSNSAAISGYSLVAATLQPIAIWPCPDIAADGIQ